MYNFARACRQFFKRHAEAFFIIAFLLADCFLSGWMLTAGTFALLAYVIVPSIRMLSTLDPAGQIAYLRALIKTPRAQRIAILLFWVYTARFLISALCSSKLFISASPAQPLPTFSNALILGAQAFAPLSYLATPLVTYFFACVLAIFLRMRLKASRKDPDLIEQRQKWSTASHYLFSSAFIAGILGITLNPSGPGYMLSNWLLASARDAHIFVDASQYLNGARFALDSPPPMSLAEMSFVGPPAPILDPADTSSLFANASFIPPFDTFVLSTLSIVLILFLAPAVSRLNAMLTSFCWRVVSLRSVQNVVEAFLEALRLPSRALNFRERHPFWTNAAKTFLWLVACYAFLFWLFGFCGGPLGFAIQNWMIASAVDAGLGPSNPAPDWMFQPNLRIFLGSVVALYGTAPLAVTAAVFLPYAKERQIVLNNDGISFANGPFFSLWGRQFRVWSDLKRLSVRRLSNDDAPLRAEFTLAFRSGGRVSFSDSQISPHDMNVLLDNIDQFAVACAVDPDVHRMCSELADGDAEGVTSDGISDTPIDRVSAQEFKSTVFVPFSPGEFLPATRTRIIKQLISKPLCAVYLAREEDGRMVTVKQFYLADDTDETRAMKKMLQSEYELLSRLDHPGIAKVVNNFSVEQSTFLVIEHRVGSDLRAVVTEHGARSEGQVIVWAKQMCEIVMYLHGREPAIIHRDLTPDNVISGEDGQMRLIDFGAAREFLEGITGTMIGKHSYVAPEQLRGNANQRSDIYSFGATLFFLLTGRDPIALSQSSPAEHIDCSEELDKLIRDCTEFDEASRPQTFEEVLMRLNAINRGVRFKLPESKEKVVA